MRAVWVYISGPMTKPDILANTGQGIAIFNRLLDRNTWDPGAFKGIYIVPICPHLSSFAHMTRPRPHAEWIAYDLCVIERCDAVLRLPGESVGADAEVKKATAMGKPVFADWGDLMVWLKSME